MLMKPVTFLLAICLTLAFSSPSAARSAEREGFTQDYMIYVGGFRTARATATGRATDGRYAFTLSAQSAGLVRIFADATFNATVEGQMTDAGVMIPDEYAHASFWDDTSYTLSMDYDDGQPTRVEHMPEREPDDDPIPPLDLQAGTLDPISGLMSLTWPGQPDQICGRTVETFSGSRRTVSEIAAPRAGKDGMLQCDLIYARIKYDEDDQPQRDKEFPFTIDLRPIGDGQWEVWKFSGPTSMGTMVVRRVE